MKLTARDVRKLITSGEALHLECKRAQGGLPASIWETYSAFCNTDGGVILLGVRETSRHVFEIEGVRGANGLIKVFWDSINNAEIVSVNTLLAHHVYVVACGKKNVIVINVPRADRRERPVYLGADVFRGTYRRNGEGDYLCSRESVMAMLRDQGDRTADATVLERTELGDLCSATIKRYRSDFAVYHPHSPWIGLPNDEFLKKIGAAARASDGRLHPTLAGLVCFGEFAAILQELPNYFLDYRERLANSERWTDREYANDPDWSGNIVDFYYRIHDKITAAAKTPFALDGNDRRIEDTDVHKAIREVVANALVHADYHGRRGIVIERDFERITISNPGTLRVAKSIAIDGGTSDPRNTSIFNIFALIDVGERSGMGLNHLFAIWEREGFSCPDIREAFDPERTILEFSTEMAEVEPDQRTSQPDQKSDQKLDRSDQKSDQKSSGMIPECLQDASSSVKSVYGAIRENSRVTYRGMAAMLGLNKDTVNTAVAVLIKRGLLRRVGEKKNGHWEVLQ